MTRLKIDEDLKDKYRLLSRDKAKQYLYEQIAICLIFGMFVFLIVVNLDAVKQYLDIPLYIQMISILALPLAIILNYEGQAYALLTENDLFIKVYDLLEPLADNINDNRDSDRKTSQIKAQEILKSIEKWDIGSLKVCKEEIEPHIAKFREAFDRKIIAALSQIENDNDHYRVFLELSRFAEFLIKPKPSINNLDSLTNSFNEIISTSPPRKGENQSITFTPPKNLLKYFLAAASIFIGAYAVVAFGEYFWDFPFSLTFAPAMGVIATFGAVLANYIIKDLKNKNPN